LILIGNAVQNGINGGDNSLTGAAIMATTLIALNYGVAYITSRSARAERIVEGAPVVIARNGKLFEKVLRRELISGSDFNEALRMNNIKDVGEVELALLETNGSISVVPKQRG
ncbi:MAG TPA: YetF domain-containing protein, partial [Thermomonas sp.]|nr:YetF domain-containing protein [Thermomonas sp.]